MTPLTLFAVTSAIVLALGSLKTEKHDYIYLIKGEDGKVGKVSIKTDLEEKVLDKDRLFVSIKDKNISEPSTISEDEFNRLYGNLLSAEPKKPKVFLLYFEQGSDKLTESSEIVINDILKEISERDDPEITILGHTDSIGNKDNNYMLGFKRAESMKNLLINKTGINIPIEISSHGEDDPLIPTPDETNEPTNRRVEVIIK